MVTWTVDETLTSIQTRGDLLDSDQRFSNTNLLLLLNEELVAWMAPVIAEMRSEYFLTTQLTQLNGVIRDFYIPSNAIAGRIRLLQLLDGNQFPRMNGVQVDLKDDVNWWAAPWLGNLGQFYFRGDELVLLGPLVAGWFLRITYERRPAQCVQVASCALVSNVTGSGPFTVTVSGFPSGMVSGTVVDFVRGNPPWNTYATQALPTPSGNNLTFASLPADLGTNPVAIGDYICFQGQAPFCQVPLECVPVIRQWLALHTEAIKSGADGLAASAELQKETEVRMRKVLAPRSVGNLKAVNNGLAYPVGGYPYPGFIGG